MSASSTSDISSERRIKVAVVGCGLVGACTSYYLSMMGYEVITIESGNDCSNRDSTSHANAGRFCPSVIASYPLASPTTAVSSAFKGFFSSSSNKVNEKVMDEPSSVSLSFSTTKWGYWYMRSCAPDRYAVAHQAFVSLTTLSNDTTRKLINQIKQNLDSNAYDRLSIIPSNLWLFNTSHELEKGIKKIEKARHAGLVKSDVLSCNKCIEKYPHLKGFFDTKEGGCVVSNDDFTADAAEFARNVTKLAEATGNATYLYNTKLIGVNYAIDPTTKQKKIAGIKVVPINEDFKAGDSFMIPVDKVVFTVGPRAKIIEDSLYQYGISVPYIPIVNVRGCSVDLTLKDDEKMAKEIMKIGVADHASGKLNFQITPYVRKDPVSKSYKNTIRLVGFADAISTDESWDANTGQTLCPSDTYKNILINRLNQVLPGVEYESISKPWCGLRPLTPDMLPLIGPIDSSNYSNANIFLNVGHGAIGWTLCAVTSRLLAEEMASKDFGINLKEQTDKGFINEKARKDLLTTCDPFRFTISPF